MRSDINMIYGIRYEAGTFFTPLPQRYLFSRAIIKLASASLFYVSVILGSEAYTPEAEE